MSKIKIRSQIKNKDGIHTFIGKGILNKNVITYKDKEVLTKITLKPLRIERIDQNTIEINLKEREISKVIYKTEYGIYYIESELIELKESKGSINIKYNLIQNNSILDTFEYNLEYSIDS